MLKRKKNCEYLIEVYGQIYKITPWNARKYFSLFLVLLEKHTIFIRWLGLGIY